MLVTMRWISCMPMNGPTLGCALMTSMARLSDRLPSVPGGMTAPRKRFSDIECSALFSAMGRRWNSTSVSGPLMSQPVNTLARPCTSALV
ncbi:hypothetical protein D3C72_1440760 [compost metagenome]